MQSAGLVGLGKFDSFFMIKNRAMGFQVLARSPDRACAIRKIGVFFDLFRIGGVYWSCAPDEGIGPTGFVFSSVGPVP